MLLLGTMVTVAGIVALLAVLLSRHSVRGHERGAVSHRWIVEHRSEGPS
jgi:hypothetical protein